MSLFILKGTIGDNQYAYLYTGPEVEAVLTYSPRTKGVNGQFMVRSDSYILENCLASGHVWKKLNVEMLGKDEGLVDDFLEVESLIGESTGNLWRSLGGETNASALASADSTTMATFSVKFYYTPEFSKWTPDIKGFFDQVIAVTNQGYANSKIPVMIKQHCSPEEATINDNPDAVVMLKSFAKMKGTASALRQTADVAALFVNDFNSCGIGYVNTIDAKYTFTATRKSCALGYYSFGHEVGHNIGMVHDPASSSSRPYPYGTGHLIEKGTASTGYRTILAFQSEGHSQRVNYYSNPNVVLPQTGTPTGVDGLSDNARLLTEKRLKLAAIGDESGTCMEETIPTTSKPPVVTAAPVTTTKKPPATACPHIENMTYALRRLRLIRNLKDADLCEEECSLDTDCEYWSFLYRKPIKRRRCQLFKVEQIKRVGWTSARKSC